MEVLIGNLQSTLIFILVLSILILVHEWGHFMTAKRLGVGVERFALGFGPTLYAKMHQGTLYMINLIPFGGYVKMAGDERSQCQGRPEEFYAKPAGHRALIILNGPLVNFIFAYVCLFFVFMMGYPDLSSKVGEIIEDYPAAEAGLQVGDQILAVDATTVENWTSLQEAIAASSAPQIQLRIRREGEEITKTIAPRTENRKTIFGKYKDVRLIGIRPAEEMVLLRYGMGTALVKASQELARITSMTYQAMFSILNGSMSAKENLTGPIGIFYVIKKAAEMGMSHLLFILGVISASLAIFNLLPIIPLDGGHLFLLGIEKVRGHALPQRVDEYISRVGFALIIFVALFVFYSDCVRFGWLDKLIQLFP